MWLSVWNLSAQAIVEPNYGIAELKYLQNENGDDGDDVKASYRELNAEIPANSEVWIPLGVFKYGDFHRLQIEAEGEATVANGSVDFTSWYNAPSPVVFTSNQLSVDGRFQLLYFKSGESIALLAKYKNTSASINEFRVTHFSPRATSWFYQTPSAEDLSAAQPLKAAVSIVAGDQDYSDYELIRGIVVNDTLNVKGNTLLEGNVSVTEAQGDISMGDYGQE